MSSAASEAVDLAAAAGFVLDDWQAWCLEGALGERADGMWAAFECGIVVPRQNGKNAILAARELAGIVLFGEDLIVHSAHRADTTLEQFRKMCQLAEEFDELARLVRRISHVNGHEHIELKGGRRINFVSRARLPGRGFSGNLVVLDEAFNLSSAAIGAMIPTLSARSMDGVGVQVWYTSSAPHEDSAVLHGVRKRGREGRDADRLFYAEWGNEDGTSCDDLDATYAANPGLGIRISEDFVLAERALMSSTPGEYLRERQGVAEALLDANSLPIPLEAWAACVAPRMERVGPVVFGVDSSPDRKWSSVVTALNTPAGRFVEVADRRPGVSWLTERVPELLAAHAPASVVIDAASPAASVVAELEAAGVEVRRLSVRDVVAACGAFHDAVVGGGLWHLDEQELRSALASARRRQVGDGWAWSRKDSGSDISALVAATLAFGALPSAVESGKPPSLGFVL